jgi:hypothetical protein
VKTYLQGSRTFPGNLSTEVLEKEAREREKIKGKLLIEKEKIENGPKMEYQKQISTELRPRYLSVTGTGEQLRCSCV